LTLYQSGNMAAVCTGDEITFPVTWNCPIFH